MYNDQRKGCGMKKYTIALFDADETLFDFSKSESAAFCEALASFGVEADEDMVVTYKKINDSLWKKLEQGEIARERLVYQRFEMFFDTYGISADAKIMAERYLSALAEKTYLIDGAKELISSLDGKVKKYIVTNGVERVQRSRYANSELYGCFDGIFISEAIGANKPDPRFFEYVAAHIDGFRKENALIIGDSLSSDILGGINFGIDTCWFSPKGGSGELSPTYTVKKLDEIMPILLGSLD